MLKSFRLLPLTMVVAFLLLGLKVGEVMHDGRKLMLSFTGDAQAQAQDTKPTDALTPPPADAKKPETAAPAAADKPADKKDVKQEGEPKVNPPSTDAPSDSEEIEPPKHEFSQVEVDLLQSLAKRRQELDDWAKQVQLKENMLIATEARINEKIVNLQKMKKDIETLLAQYNEQEDTKIRSLVKIYENMKPKDAARIFEELDMPVLLTVVDRMSERKVAPILGLMNPTKAKDLTIQLAEQRKLQKPRAGGANSGDAAATAPANPDSASPTTPPSATPAPANNR